MNLGKFEDGVLAEEQLLEDLGDKNKEDSFLTAEKIRSPDLAISVREATRLHSLKSMNRSHTC